jgi:hypothetical protein
MLKICDFHEKIWWCFFQARIWFVSTIHQSDKWAGRNAGKHQTDTYRDIHTDIQTNTQSERLTDHQINRQKLFRQTDKHIHTTQQTEKK